MKRLLVAMLSALMVLGIVAPAAASSAGASVAAQAVQAERAPKVVLVVGPVAHITDSYRAMAREAAQVARRYTPNVVEIYSPDATWPRVAEALQGASIVVYLGHGNGWPSRYRDSLYPPTQNGFGLNPVAGVDDSAHQYFGEASLDQIKLAPNAIVLLHHLCYASGNTEPGLPEGTYDQAIQRVDNYAAGFIRAGARAVVAEGHFEPAWYVRQLLTTDRSIESIWRGAPSRNGHERTFRSVRSRGYHLRMDPERQTSRFYRSLVTKGNVKASVVRQHGAPVVTAAIPQTPSLIDLGLVFKTPRFSELPIAGSTADLSLPVPGGRAKELPDDLRIGVRWDPIQVAAAPAAPTVSEGTAPAASAPGTTTPDANVGAGTTGQATPETPPDVEPEPPDVALVVAERPGSVVETVQARFGRTRVAVKVAFPSTPGLYRLVPSLHQSDGSAYDAASQALLTPVLVRVGGPLSAAFGITGDVDVTAGQPFELKVRVANTGVRAWSTTIEQPVRTGNDDPEADRDPRRVLPARIVATWVSTTGTTVPAAAEGIVPEGASQPGGSGLVTLRGDAPATAGSYLLLVDVATPEFGAISATGSDPALIRVTVADPPPPPPPTPPVRQQGT